MQINGLNRTNTYAGPVASSVSRNVSVEPTQLDSFQSSVESRESSSGLATNFLSTLTGNFSDRQDAEQAKLDNHRAHEERLKVANHVRHLQYVAGHSSASAPAAPAVTPAHAAPTHAAAPVAARQPSLPTPSKPAAAPETVAPASSAVNAKQAPTTGGKVLFEDNFNGPNGQKLDASKYVTNYIDATGTRRSQTGNGENAVQDEHNTVLENGMATAFVSKQSTQVGSQTLDYQRGGMETKNFSFNLGDTFKKGQSIEIDFRGQHSNMSGVKDDLVWLTPKQGTNTSDGKAATEVDLSEDHAGITGHAWSKDWTNKTVFHSDLTKDINGMADYSVNISQDKKTGLGKLTESVTYKDSSGKNVTKTYAQADGQGSISTSSDFYLRMLSQEVECKWPGQKIDPKAPLGLGATNAEAMLDYVKVSAVPG